MRYVDGFILPIPKSKLQLYRQIAPKAGKVWREHVVSMMDPKSTPFDMKRMVYGGFRVLVDL